MLGRDLPTTASGTPFNIVQSVLKNMSVCNRRFFPKKLNYSLQDFGLRKSEKPIYVTYPYKRDIYPLQLILKVWRQHAPHIIFWSLYVAGGLTYSVQHEFVNNR